MTSTMLELILMFRVPLSIKSDAKMEFTTKVSARLYRWLMVELDHGFANHPHSRGVVENDWCVAPDGLRRTLKLSRARWDDYARATIWNSKNYAGPVPPPGWDTLDEFIRLRHVFKPGSSYSCAGRR